MSDQYLINLQISFRAPLTTESNKHTNTSLIKQTRPPAAQYYINDTKLLIA